MAIASVEYPAGERLFVDFAGQTVGVVDPATGEIRATQIFVAVLGASNLTYAKAVFKRVTGDGLRSRTDGRQATEVAVAIGVLNRMLDLGRPEYVRIA